eukprot:4612740-Prymnesium_polylepis.1
MSSASRGLKKSRLKLLRTVLRLNLGRSCGASSRGRRAVGAPAVYGTASTGSHVQGRSQISRKWQDTIHTHGKYM